ncbi:DUF1638 domain-containing protein [Chloroflexota bacterium]
MLSKSRKTKRIIACAVFKSILEDLHLENRYPNLWLTYIPSKLHLHPQALKKRLWVEIVAAQKNSEMVICLYGGCFPGIDDLCQQHGVMKVPGHFCHEMILGSERFKRLVDEVAGTYFVEKDLILNFEEYCVRPLELRDEEMRRCCFQRYRRLLYVRQASDPDLVPQAGKIAEFLGLSLGTSDADYSHLEKTLTELLR